MRKHVKAEKSSGLWQSLALHQYRAILDGLCRIMLVCLGCFTSPCKFRLSVKQLNRSCLYTQWT